MPSLKTESVLWYNVGAFGNAGYAVPNWGDNIGSMNTTIRDLVTAVGRNLFAFMHHDDADLRTPPSINSIQRINKLCLRVRSILASRSVASGTPNMETVHAEPAPDVFMVYPCPYFKVRNGWLKTYGSLVFQSLTEMMQHSENRKPIEISTDFGSLIGQYFARIYKMMSVELLGVDPAKASDPAFVIDSPTLAAYDPSRFFTSTELVDTVPRFDQIFTAAQLGVLSEGILVTNLPELTPYPSQIALLSGQPSVVGGSDFPGVYNGPTNPNAPLQAPVLGTPTLNLGGALGINVPFSYVVTSLSANAESAPSNQVSITPITQGYQLAGLTWSRVNGAIGYRIYRSTSSDFTNSLVVTITSGSITTFNDPGTGTNPGNPPSAPAASGAPAAPAAAGQVASTVPPFPPAPQA